MMSSLDGLPESLVDDSNDDRHHAMRAIGIIMDAIVATDRVVATKYAHSASEGMANLAADLDFILVKETNNPPSVDTAEQLSQAVSLDLAEATTSESDGLAQIRERTSCGAEAFRRAAGMIAAPQ